MNLALLRICLNSFLLFVLLSPFAAKSQNTLQLINSNETISLNGHLSILQEGKTPLTIAQIRKRKSEFVRISKKPNQGMHDTGIWVHSSFSNVTDAEEWIIDISFSHLDKVDFYLFDGTTLLASANQGTQRLGRDYRFPTLKATLPYATPIDLFIRVEASQLNIVIPIDIQSYKKHMRSNFWDNLIWGLFYGGLFILAIYNLILYIGNRELSLLAFVAYVSSALVWKFIWGGHFAMVFPNGFTPWLSQHIALIFILLGITAGLFTYSFLEAKRTAPKSAPFVFSTIVLFAILGFCSSLNLIPAQWQNMIVHVSGLLAILIYISAGIESYINKVKSARYFILAWVIFAFCSLLGMLTLFGYVPSNLFTIYCFQAGIFIKVSLFSIAIMDKSRGQLESEVLHATNDLRNNLEYIEEQNARLDIARKDAINASQIKSQFLANMSHEIRTPLNAILGFSKELKTLPLPTDKLEHVVIINSAADSLLRIVNDVLDVSKIEAGKLQISNHPFSPNELLEDTVNVMSQSAQQKQLEFIFRLAPLPEKLVGDSQRIQQVLINLLGNALKFTSSGHISLSVSGETLDNNTYQMQFLVEDTGIGISQQDRKKLFSAFSQIDDATSRSYQGTGLGLVICKQLVQMMAGRIDLTSVPGEGSCFSVTIKTNLLNNTSSFAQNQYWKDRRVGIYDSYSLSKHSLHGLLGHAGANSVFVDSLLENEECFETLFVSLPQSEIADRQRTLNSIQPDQYQQLVLLYSGQNPESIPERLQEKLVATLRLPLTISKLASISDKSNIIAHNPTQDKLHSLPPINLLAVDDIEMNLKLLETWLARTSVNLTLSFSGEDAVSLCQKHEYDLILMDVQMPSMDGLMASKLIRKTELNLGTPIVAVTAHALKEEQERLLASGMDDYLPKPISLEDLIELIIRWCGEKNVSEQEPSAIDWTLAVKRANGNIDAAKELFNAFIQQLPEMVEDIVNNKNANDYIALQNNVHKLHGVSCYTGVPKLEALCDEIESALKNAEQQWAKSRVVDLADEASRVLNLAEMES